MFVEHLTVEVVVVVVLLTLRLLQSWTLLLLCLVLLIHVLVCRLWAYRWPHTVCNCPEVRPL